MTRDDDLRQLAKVAELYHERGLKQSEISAHLGMHQSSISRLLKRAEQEGVVRISLNYPAGFYPELERFLEERFGLAQAIVVDSAHGEAELVRRLGSATAVYLSSTVRRADVVGISSWSSSLLAMVNALSPVNAGGAKVVQILGGVGAPNAEVHATHLTQRLAQLIGGAPVLLTAPGVVRSSEARDILRSEPYVRMATDLFDSLTVALVGIGALEPSRLLADSGNALEPGELTDLREHGAVGDICLRFFDRQGKPVASPVNDQVIGISLEQLKATPRVVGVAGGMRKREAIHAALRGGWIDVLITDQEVARAIMDSEPARAEGARQA